MNGSRRRMMVLAGVLAAGIAAAVVIVVATRDGGPPRIAISTAYLDGLPPRGPLRDDADLVQRAAQAWQRRTDVLGTGGPEIHVLWAGPRNGHKLVLLGRAEKKSRWLRVASYAERNAGDGVIERDGQVSWGDRGIMLDGTGLLLHGPSADRYRMVADDGEKTTTTRPAITDGVIEVGRRAMLLPEPGHPTVLIVRDGVVGSLDLLDNEREQLMTWAAEAGDRLLSATLAGFAVGRPDNDDEPNLGNIAPIWRGRLPSLDGDVVVVRLRVAGQTWLVLSTGRDRALRFTAQTTLGTVPSPGPVACSPEPGCHDPTPTDLPYLLAFWTGNPVKLFVVGAPAITKVTVRVGPVTRELAGPTLTVSLADLGLPALKWSPAVSVVGQTADGTQVPALIGW